MKKSYLRQSKPYFLAFLLVLALIYARPIISLISGDTQGAQAMLSKGCSAYDGKGNLLGYANAGEYLFFVPGGWRDPRIFCYKGFWEEGTTDDWNFRTGLSPVNDVPLCTQKGSQYVDRPNGSWKIGTVSGTRIRFATPAIIPTKPLEPSENHSASGLAYNKTTNTLFWVDDDTRRIIEIDTNGNRTSRPPFMVPGTRKLEGITHVTGNQYAVVDEKERKIVLFEVTPENTILVNASFTFPGLDDTDGLEGVAYHAKRDSFFVAKEKNSKRIYELKRNGSTFSIISSFDPVMPAGVTPLRDFAALAIHPNGNVFIFSEADNKILEIKPDGAYVSTYIVPDRIGLRPEGLDFDTEYVYIVGEGGDGGTSKFAKYAITWCNP